MIQRLNSYNLLAHEVVEKVSGTIYRPDKKNRPEKYQRVGNELSINENT